MGTGFSYRRRQLNHEAEYDTQETREIHLRIM